MVAEVETAIVAARHNNKPLVIADFPKHCKSIRKPRNQLSYTVNTGDKRWSTTYFFATGVDPRTILTRFRCLCDSHPHLMAKLVFALYSQNFEFVCSAKGAVAFLHEHIELHTVIRRISFRYTFEPYETTYQNCPDPILVVPTDFSEFRRFSNIPIHQMSGLVCYKLILHAKFWETAPWEKGVHAVFSKPDLLQRYEYYVEKSRYRNFFWHFARLVPFVSGPLLIDGTDDAAKRRFANGLGKAIHMERLCRSDVVRVRPCRCDDLGRDRDTVERCCMYDLPPAERKYGVPPPLKELDKKIKKEAKEKLIEESKKLRTANKNPPDSVALEYLGGFSFEQYTKGFL